MEKKDFFLCAETDFSVRNFIVKQIVIFNKKRHLILRNCCGERKKKYEEREEVNIKNFKK